MKTATEIIESFADTGDYIESGVPSAHMFQGSSSIAIPRAHMFPHIYKYQRSAVYDCNDDDYPVTLRSY